MSTRSQPLGSVRQHSVAAQGCPAAEAPRGLDQLRPASRRASRGLLRPGASLRPLVLTAAVACLLCRFSRCFAAIAGKSSLLSSLLGRDFSEDYEPTVVATHRHTLTMKGGRVRFDLKIVDTAGQDEFSTIPTEASLGVHGYILVFDVTSRTSFEKLRHINDKLLEAIGADAVPRVVVANKSDLRPDS